MSKPAACSRREGLRAVLAALLGAAGAPAAFAEAWPARPLRWIVAYPAGGGSDYLARSLAPSLARRLGQAIVVDNRPGAGGVIGTEAGAVAPPDGYTMFSGDNGSLVFQGAMGRRLGYDPLALRPVAPLARFPLVLVVSPASGWTDVRSLVDAAKRAPGAFSYASPGIGSPHHLAMELLKQRAGIFVVHVPYRGTGPALQDVIAGQLPMMIVDTAGGLPQIRAGKARALAVLSGRRIASLPDVPTLAESGFPGLEATAWQGLFVPSVTPDAIVGRLGAELKRVLAEEEVAKALREFGLEPMPGDAGTLSALLREEIAFWHPLIRERRLAVE